MGTRRRRFAGAAFTRMTAASTHPWAPLAADVHVVAIGADLVFLDLARDRYACLPGLAGAARPDAARRGLRIDDRRLADELRAAGLTGEAAAGPRPAWRAPPPPTASALPAQIERPRAADVWPAARAVLDLAVAYRGRTLPELIRRARPTAAPSGLRDPPDPGALRHVADFHRWAPFAPTQAKCLLRAFMLLRGLQRQDRDALWVFGVRTWPFEAHCWLQIGGTVLDDDVDRVAALAPILVV